MDKQEFDENRTDRAGLSDVNDSLNARDITAAEKHTENTGTVKSFVLETLQTIILALILYFLIDTFVARVRVDNISMEPTLQPGEFLLVDRAVFRLDDLKTGDIVVFHYPLNPEEDYIKRVIGVPGDHVKVVQGEVFVNDTRLEEPYLLSVTAYEGDWVIPEDSFFVLGDNRNQSFDSHSWGFVPRENLIGRAFFIYWPINEIKLLQQPQMVQAAGE